MISKLVRSSVLPLCLMASLEAHPLILSPNGGEVLVAGSTYTIRWQVLVMHSTQKWNLSYSTTGLVGTWLPIASDLPAGNIAAGSIHSHAWKVPATMSSTVRIRIEQVNGGRNYLDWSDQDLAITVPGSYERIGAGCAGLAGVPRIRAVGGSVPRIGQVFSVDVTNLRIDSPLSLLLTGLPLSTPVDLGMIGAPGCVVLVNSYVHSSLKPLFGSAIWAVRLPNQPVLIGSEFYQQVLTLDASANRLGLAVSAALHGVVGIM